MHKLIELGAALEKVKIIVLIQQSQGRAPGAGAFGPGPLQLPQPGHIYMGMAHSGHRRLVMIIVPNILRLLLYFLLQPVRRSGGRAVEFFRADTAHIDHIDRILQS